MCACSRRDLALMAGGGMAALFARPARAMARDEKGGAFVAAAVRMKRDAVANGDQPYGAVVVKDGAIIGYGPSRVVTDRNPNAHAERVALWDAQRRLGVKPLPGAIIYSTSRPCSACQRELAGAGIARMFFGPGAADAGSPNG